MRELWTSDAPSFAGRFVNFSGIQSRPQPVTAGGPPIVAGGNSPAAYRRAVTRCQGWYGFALTPDDTRRCLDGIASASNEHARPAELGQLEISVTPRQLLTEELLREFEDMGVARLILLQSGRTEEELLQFVEQTARQFIN